MLLNLRNMRRMRVDDVSVPRADIVAISEQATLDEVVAVFQESTLSRLPVYSETLDQPVGLVHLKDLALKYGFGAPAETSTWAGCCGRCSMRRRRCRSGCCCRRCRRRASTWRW